MSKMKVVNMGWVLMFLALGTLVSNCRAAEPKGWLILEGGAKPLNPAVTEKFRELIGGADAPVLLIPTAADEERLQRAKASGEAEEYITDLGLKNCKLFHTRDHNEANSEAFVAPIRTAKGVWLSGGHVGLLAEAYLGTSVQKELQAFYDRGGVIGGSSAGAMIMGSFMIHGGPLGEQKALVNPKHHEGFGIIKNVIFIAHVNHGHYEGELAQMVADYPELLGIGLDEGTAILVHDREFEVIGGKDARVTIADGKQHDGQPYYFLHLGDRFDLSSRSVKSAH